MKSAVLQVSLFAIAIAAQALLGAQAAHAQVEESSPGLAAELAEPANAAALDAISRSPETLNKATFLHLGRNSMPMRLKLISEAQSYVFITSQYWYHDHSGTALIDALKARKEELAHEGKKLEIRILQDWTSPYNNSDLWGKDLPPILRELADGLFLEWNRLWEFRSFSADIFSNRIHDKIFAVDGTKLIVGGMNNGDSYLEGGLNEGGLHDSDVLLEGPAAQLGAKFVLKPWLIQQYLDRRSNPFPTSKKVRGWGLQQIVYGDTDGFSFTRRIWPFKAKTKTVSIPLSSFLKDKRYFPELPADPSRTTPVRLIWDNPLVDHDPMTGRHFSKYLETLEFVVSKAKSSVRLFMPYLTTTDRMNRVLTTAAKRGIKVTVITNDRLATDLSPLDFKATLPNYNSLIDAGVELHEWQGHHRLKEFYEKEGCKSPDYWPGRMIHTKMAIVDEQVVFMGSNNMNARSLDMNTELMAMLRDPGFAKQAVAVFEDDLSDEGRSAAERTVECDGRTFPGRPPRTEKVKPGWLSREFRAEGHELRFLHHFQHLM